MFDASKQIFKKQCTICGDSFTVDWSRRRAVYCCDECRSEAIRRQRKAKNHYHKPAVPTERICKKCGKPFIGRHKQGYCLTCLHDGSAYMNKLLSYRSEG